MDVPDVRATAGTCAAGNPVALVKTRAEGVPRFGVVIAHDVVIQNDPDPLIPVHVQLATFEDGAPNSITLFADGTAFGDSSLTEVVIEVGAPHPNEFAATVADVP